MKTVRIELRLVGVNSVIDMFLYIRLKFGDYYLFLYMTNVFAVKNLPQAKLLKFYCLNFFFINEQNDFYESVNTKLYSKYQKVIEKNGA